MLTEELFSTIKTLIKNKGTHPPMITFAELSRGVPKDNETRDSYKELLRTKRIRVRQGINLDLIEIIKK